MNWLKYLQDRIQGKAPKGKKRSKDWRSVRSQHLEAHPQCEICGGTSKVEVHHIIPFHIDDTLELDPKNLITLCERKKFGINCHLLVGHLGNYRRANPQVEIDAVTWRMKLEDK